MLLLRPPRASSGLLAEYAKRAAPRIGGSVGGFIAVVVCLCVIILASCIAIFILLRDREPSANEREARRAARDRSRRSTVEPAPAPAPAPAPSPAPTPWGSLSHMFRNATRGGHGWIQASGDAWEADEADAGREMGMARQHEDAPFRPPADPYALADDAELRWTPRFTASHSTFSDLHAIPRSASPESDHTEQQQQPHDKAYGQSRQFSADSLCSVRTFEGGTKFIEEL